MSYLDEIKFLQTIIKEYNELKNIYSNIDKYILPFINYIEPYTYNLKTKAIYYNNNELYIDNNINPNINLYQNLSMFSKINLKKILIITSNVNIIETCLFLNKSQIIKIKLFVINIDHMEQFILLKEKYKNLIDIFYIGYKFDYDMYVTITSLLQNEKFSSIILDYSDSNKLYNGNELSTALLILLSNNYLDDNSYCVNYNKLPTQNNTLIYLYNILFNCFYNHDLNNLNLYNYNDINNHKIIFLYNNFKQKISKKDEDFIINFLKSDRKAHSNYNLNLSQDFLDNIKHIWNKIVITHKENLIRVRNILHNKKVTKRLVYHRNNLKSIESTKINKIPEYVSDIPVTDSVYDINALDHQSKCHWGQKKLLLSEIQFFTRICKTLNTKSLKDFTVVYIGSAAGNHLPILYNLFPSLLWLLYDPAPFSKEVTKHPTKDKSVFVYNMFFTDKTLDHVRKNCQGRKILFISDIRVDTKEADIIKDMRDQAFWATELNSPFMLLKFRLPYEELDTIPKSNLQFKLNNKLFTNPNFKTTKHMIYLKGDIYLQIFPPPYSGELRLYVEQKDGKYEFAEYNYLDIENRLVFFNSYIRPYFHCFENDNICKEHKYINYIPGYDTSIECLMEYDIVMKYYEYFWNIKDKKIIIQKLYDMNFYLEKLAHRKFITCNNDTTIKYFKKTNINDNDKYNKLKIWKDISKFNIELSAKTQYKIIKEDGLSILGDKRYQKALDYLKPFITNKSYVEL